MTVASQDQSEKVLVWLSGLMGAGIFSVQGLLASVPLSMRLVAFVPWTLGILSAMVGRLLAGELQNKNDVQHFNRISMLELLQLETDKALIAKNLRPVIEAGSLANDAKSRTLNRLHVATNAAFYLTHVLFAVGVVAAVTTMIVAGR